MSKCHFVSVVPWRDIRKYLLKCEVCAHFCFTLYIYIYTYVCTYIYIYINTHTHTHTDIYIYIYIYVGYWLSTELSIGDFLDIIFQLKIILTMMKLTKLGFRSSIYNWALTFKCLLTWLSTIGKSFAGVLIIFIIILFSFPLKMMLYIYIYIYIYNLLHVSNTDACHYIYI